MGIKVRGKKKKKRNKKLKSLYNRKSEKKNVKEKL